MIIVICDVCIKNAHGKYETVKIENCRPFIVCGGCYKGKFKIPSWAKHPVDIADRPETRRPSVVVLVNGSIAYSFNAVS